MPSSMVVPQSAFRPTREEMEEGAALVVARVVEGMARFSQLIVDS